MIILWGYQYLNATRRFDYKGYYMVLINTFVGEELINKFKEKYVIERLCGTVKAINEKRSKDYVEFYIKYSYSC